MLPTITALDRIAEALGLWIRDLLPSQQSVTSALTLDALVGGGLAEDDALQLVLIVRQLDRTYPRVRPR